MQCSKKEEENCNPLQRPAFSCSLFRASIARREANWNPVSFWTNSSRNRFGWFLRPVGGRITVKEVLQFLA
ncbi:AAEL006204-PA [Aedes aegypti]|uniref:AAEL006204-PA n=1 Tax=Aedes aegypti TaxID=7159 RepID=Q177A0_AEDAE|nr:AAEL006204-PA [Aedes aegypti]